MQRSLRPIFRVTGLQLTGQQYGWNVANYGQQFGWNTANYGSESSGGSSSEKTPAKSVGAAKPRAVTSPPVPPVKAVMSPTGETPVTEFRNDTYQSSLYYTYNERSFYDLESELIRHRAKQPTPSKKY